MSDEFIDKMYPKIMDNIIIKDLTSNEIIVSKQVDVKKNKINPLSIYKDVNIENDDDK